MNKNPHSGNMLDDFLKDEGIYDEVTALTHKRLLALQLQDIMDVEAMSKTNTLQDNQFCYNENMNQKMIGRYIVTHPEICHGKPTFRGTRIMVWQVLEQVATGMAWETIEEEWRGRITKDAISEAIRLASQALMEHADDYAFDLVPA